MNVIVKHLAEEIRAEKSCSCFWDAASHAFSHVASSHVSIPAAHPLLSVGVPRDPLYLGQGA